MQTARQLRFELEKARHELERAKTTNRHLNSYANELAHQLATEHALQLAGDPDFWIWMDDEDNRLETMSEDMPIRITARQLRQLLAKGSTRCAT